MKSLTHGQLCSWSKVIFWPIYPGRELQPITILRPKLQQIFMSNWDQSFAIGTDFLLAIFMEFSWVTICHFLDQYEMCCQSDFCCAIHYLGSFPFKVMINNLFSTESNNYLMKRGSISAQSLQIEFLKQQLDLHTHRVITWIALTLELTEHLHCSTTHESR